MKKTYILRSLFLITYVYLTLSYIYGTKITAKSAPPSLNTKVKSVNNPNSSGDMHIVKLIEQGDIHYNEENYRTATVCYNEALQKYRKVHPKKDIIHALISHNLGMSYLALKMYFPQSYIYLYYALSIRQEILSKVDMTNDHLFKENIRKASFQSYYNIGCLHLAMCNPQIAMEAFKAALDTESSSVSCSLKVQPAGNVGVGVPDAVGDAVDIDDKKRPTGVDQLGNVSQASQPLYSMVLAKQASLAPKKEKGLNEVLKKIVGIGEAKRTVLSLNSPKFPQENKKRCKRLQVKKRLSASRQISSTKKRLSDKPPHTRSKKISSTKCGNKCRDNTNLTVPMRMHTEEKPFCCSFCDKKFTRKTNMKVHLRVHRKEKPFSCNFCQKSFSGKENIKAHLRIHTVEKPFASSIRQKNFTRKQHMKKDMDVDTGKKLFSCPLCPKKFALQDNVKRHMHTHTEEKNSPSQLYHKQLSRKNYIKGHTKGGRKNAISSLATTTPRNHQVRGTCDE